MIVMVVVVVVALVAATLTMKITKNNSANIDISSMSMICLGGSAYVTFTTNWKNYNSGRK